MVVNRVIIILQINLDTKLADFTVFNWRPLGRYPDVCVDLSSVAAVQGLG
jgi:hypothetical protein